MKLKMEQNYNLKSILKKKYEAQVLLIVLLVIFVATLILIGVQNRNKSSTDSTINDRTSAEAVGILNIILDDLSIYNVSDFEKILNNKTEYVEDWANHRTDITDLIKMVAKSKEKEATIPFKEDTNNCNLNIEGNKYILNISTANDNTAYFISSGQSWSMPLNNSFKDDSTCSLNLWLEQKDSKAGFIIYKTYAHYDKKNNNAFVGYKNYDYNEDSLNYCLSDDGQRCNNENFFGTWTKYVGSTEREKNIISIPLTSKYQDEGIMYQLEKITVKALNGRVGILYSMTDEKGKDCSEGFKILKFSLDVYCNGSFSGKDVLVPEWGWYEPIFDYTFYNGVGSMKIDN